MRSSRVLTGMQRFVFRRRYTVPRHRPGLNPDTLQNRKAHRANRGNSLAIKTLGLSMKGLITSSRGRTGTSAKTDANSAGLILGIVFAKPPRSCGTHSVGCVRDQYRIHKRCPCPKCKRPARAFGAGGQLHCVGLVIVFVFGTLSNQTKGYGGVTIPGTGQEQKQAQSLSHSTRLHMTRRGAALEKGRPVRTCERCWTHCLHRPFRFQNLVGALICCAVL